VAIGAYREIITGSDKPSVYAHLRGLLSHGRSPLRSCPLLVLAPLRFTFGILSLKKGLVLVQGTCTPQVSRHARHTQVVNRSRCACQAF